MFMVPLFVLFGCGAQEPRAQVDIAVVRQYREQMLVEMQALVATERGIDPAVADEAALLVSFFAEQFSAAEISVPSGDGATTELRHDDCDHKWAFTLTDPLTPHAQNATAVWSPGRETVFFDSRIKPSPAGAAVLFHELKHVVDDVLTMGRGEPQLSATDQERRGHFFQAEMMNAASHGVLRRIVDGEIARRGLVFPETPVLITHVLVVPNELFSSVLSAEDVNTPALRDAVYSSAMITLNRTLVLRTVDPTLREARLRVIVDEYMEAAATNPNSAMVIYAEVFEQGALPVLRGQGY